jgi:hypothetical protein
MKKRNKKGIKIIYGILLLIIGVTLFWSSIYFNAKLNLEEFELPIILEVSNTTAFNLEKENLNLGRIARGSSAHQRSIILDNSYDFPVFAYLSVEGDVKELLLFQTPVKILVNESKNIPIGTVVIDENQPFGNYTGILFVKIRKH